MPTNLLIGHVTFCPVPGTVKVASLTGRPAAALTPEQGVLELSSFSHHNRGCLSQVIGSAVLTAAPVLVEDEVFGAFVLETAHDRIGERTGYTIVLRLPDIERICDQVTRVRDILKAETCEPTAPPPPPL
jgi:hypothetical protein